MSVRVSDRLMILDMGKLDNFRGRVGRYYALAVLHPRPESSLPFERRLLCTSRWQRTRTGPTVGGALLHSRRVYFDCIRSFMVEDH